MSSPMPSSSTQAACSSSYSFSDYAEASAQFVMRLVQTWRSVVEAAAHSAGNWAGLTGYLSSTLSFVACKSLINSNR
ncbi:hypothetical protein OIU79_001493 [Salix purpurea]|uniref:Uncharacterized protein n=1 Tax=Salix purpurea TaxID=77065 RepID=A0A9Q0ZH28_SALPP|nr:hypothetical protein OIU79_001493 [Salix purpurea]